MLKRGFQFAPGYRLQEFLGRGQFGQVWRATAPGGTAAAVKFIDLSDGQGEKEYDGVRRVKQIRHANLMPITAIWLLDGEGKIIDEAPDEAIETIDFSNAAPRGESAVMKEVEPSWLVVAMLLGGQSLHQRMRECISEGRSGIPPKELISYMDESAKGIDFLNAPRHDLGEGPIAIQHSDVKPANIVLIGSSAVVCDFGLARILTRNQVTATSAAGTPAYMAPEAISRKPSRTSDQYALAVTYYHLRTGCLPMEDGSLWEVLDAHRQGKLKFGLVHQAEQEVLRKATHLNWEERFDTNVEMVDALREALRVEGHTKPSFVASSTPVQKVQPGTDGTGPTAAVADDPTATLDTAFAAPRVPADQTMHPTEPFVQAEIPTDEKFLDPTESPLRPTTAELPTADHPFLAVAKRNPKVAFSVVGGALVLLLGFMIVSSGSPDSAGTNFVPAPVVPVDDSSDADGVEEKSAEKLFREALALFDEDEAIAVQLCREAIELDQVVFDVPMKELFGHKTGVIHADISPDGKHLVTVGDAPRLWDLTDLTLPSTLLDGHTDLVEAVAFSPRGDRLITAGYDKNPLVWNLTQGDVADTSFPLTDHAAAVLTVTWHPSEPIVVTTSDDPSIGIWRLGRATDGQPNGSVEASNRFMTTETMKAAVIDDQARWLVTISDPLGGSPAALAYRWDDVLNVLSVDASPKPITVSAKGIGARIIAFASDQDDHAVLVVGDNSGSVSLYEMSDSPKLISRSDAHSSFVEALRVIPGENSDVIVSGSIDGSVQWWKTGATDRKRKQFFSTQLISSVDASSDSRWVAAGSHDGSVWLWDAFAKDSAAIKLTTPSPIHVVQIDPKSRWLIAGCADGTIRCWSLKEAKLLALAQPTPIDSNIDGPTKTIETRPLAARNNRQRNAFVVHSEKRSELAMQIRIP